MRLTTPTPTRALLLSAPKAATWGRDGEPKTDAAGVPLCGAFVMLLAPGGRTLRRWVEWPMETPPDTPANALPMLVTIEALAVELYDRKDGGAGVSLSAGSVVPVS